MRYERTNLFPCRKTKLCDTLKRTAVLLTVGRFLHIIA